MKRLVSSLCAVLCLLFFLPLLPTGSVQAAGAVTDTIGVYIGYFGWDEDQYVEKATYTWQELDDQYGGALSTYENVYSYYSGSRTYLVAARGFSIRDLLEYAGVDFGSIANIDFFTKDQTIGAYRTFTKESLFDAPRYYFPNLAADEANGPYAYNGGDITDGAVRVEPMLALEDYTQWDSVGSEFEKLYDSSMFSPISRFHLFFGQLSPTEANTSSAAKYVYKLLITFSGTPKLSTSETNISLKVGSSFRMTVNVTAEDSLLDQYVKDNLKWSSNNTSVVDVDNYGNLTVKGEGEAVVTASFQGSSVSATVKVNGNEVSTTGGGSATADSGSGQTSGAGENDGGTADANAAETAAATADQTNEVQFSENNSGVYILSSELMEQDEYAEWVNSILNHDYIENDGDGALVNARKEGMDGDAEQLIVLSSPKSFARLVFTVLIVFFALGFGYEILSYRRKMKFK
ncbi:MAG: Ig-like domain-containing protein [Oscillospiraceae bacterium]|nr:Ig-like domain-containing protein [Oscillospiraceae bacterium]